MGSKYFDIKNVKSYSGGTEATSFNPRMVHAMSVKAFPIKLVKSGKNPHYSLNKRDQSSVSIMFSKKYDDAFNPQHNYIAVMVCDHADQNCPIVFGADHRFSLKYKDPKEFDDTVNEENAYLKKVDEIGREILYMLEHLKSLKEK